MDIRQLSALIAVADHGSFSAAARALHTVQSNISTHVARLERELGVILVDRGASGMTEEGALVVSRARRVLGELDALEADVLSMRDEVAGSSRLGVIGTTARWLLPPLLDALEEAYPKVRLLVVDATTTSLVPQVLSGELESAVVNLPTREPDLVEELLFVEEHMVVAPLDHPLAEFDEVELSDIVEHKLVLATQGTTFRDELDAEAARLGLELRPKAEIDGMRLVASLAFQGYGAAVLPSSAAPGWLDPGGHWKRIAMRGLTGRSVGLVRRRRGLPSAPSRVVMEVLALVIARDGADVPGVHPVNKAGK